MARRARVKVTTSQAVTRAQAAAEFGRNKTRLKRKSRRRRRVLIGAGILAAYTLVGGWWLMHTGKFDRTINVVAVQFWKLTGALGFTLDEIDLQGRNHAEADAIKKALGIAQGVPILSLPLADMKQRLETVPEVKSAAIARKLPGTLQVTVIERIPAALWQSEGKLRLIDKDGVPLSKERYREKAPLPLVVGKDAPQHIGELLALLEAVPSLKSEITAAVRVGGRRWNIEMTRDITVMLPEENPEAAWKRFGVLVNEKALLSKAIRSVDMRMEDRVFIMPVEENKGMITLSTTARDT